MAIQQRAQLNIYASHSQFYVWRQISLLRKTTQKRIAIVG